MTASAGITLAAAAVLASIHLFAGKLRFLVRPPWAGGVAALGRSGMELAAYVSIPLTRNLTRRSTRKWLRQSEPKIVSSIP